MRLIEDTLFSRQLAQEHHAYQEQVDIAPFGNGLARKLEWHKAKHDQQKRSAGDPPNFSDAAGARQHQGDADGDDQRQNDMHNVCRYHYHFFPFLFGPS
jgi:hypothetical protein